MGRRLVWPLLAAVLAMACGDDGTGPAITGTFEAFVSGEFSQDLGGTAEFGVFTGEGFGMSLQPDDPFQSLGIGHQAEARPDVGTHAIDTPDAGAFFALYHRQLPEGQATFISRSGELVITSSSEARLEGTFTLTARGTIAGDPFEREVQIEGSFSASCNRAARCE